MDVRLIAAWPLDGYCVWLAFSDGLEGALDLEALPLTTAHPELRDLREFRRLRVDRHVDAVVWANGAAIDAGSLYLRLRRDQTARRRSSLRHR